MRHIGLIPRKSRSLDVGIYIPRKAQRLSATYTPLGRGLNPSGEGYSGAGIIEDANALYQQSKVGAGLKLAGQGNMGYAGMGLDVAGGSVNTAGEGLSPAGSGIILPGAGLRKNIIESSGKDFSPAPMGMVNSMGMGYAPVKRGKKMRMRGLGDPPLLNKVQSALSDVIIPKMMDNFGISNIVPQTLIDKVVETSTDKPDSTVHDVIVDLTKKIMPIVTQSKLAQAGVTSGGAYKKIIKSKGYKQLHGKMGRYIASELSGNQNGGDFFGDMWSGFKSVFQTVAPILGPVASVLAPEFAPLIGAATTAIGNL